MKLKFMNGDTPIESKSHASCRIPQTQDNRDAFHKEIIDGDEGSLTNKSKI